MGKNLSGLEGAVNLDSSEIDEAARKSASLGKNLSGLEGAVNLDSSEIDDAIRKSATLEKQMAGMSNTRTLQVDNVAIDESIKKSADLEKQLSGMSGASVQVDDKAIDNAVRKSAILDSQLSEMSGASVRVNDKAIDNAVRKSAILDSQLSEMSGASVRVDDKAIENAVRKSATLDRQLSGIPKASVRVDDKAIDNAKSKTKKLNKEISSGSDLGRIRKNVREFRLWGKEASLASRQINSEIRRSQSASLGGSKPKAQQPSRLDLKPVQILVSPSTEEQYADLIEKQANLESGLNRLSRTTFSVNLDGSNIDLANKKLERFTQSLQEISKAQLNEYRHSSKTQNTSDELLKAQQKLAEARAKELKFSQQMQAESRSLYLGYADEARNLRKSSLKEATKQVDSQMLSVETPQVNKDAEQIVLTYTGYTEDTKKGS
ncbi:MAG: hypothetical protein F6J93_34455, partial [Oscillatoria sp. SIO1A7]|nr:hypothetical protein [Oscillatoria sp. SIO1A7]